MQLAAAARATLLPKYRSYNLSMMPRFEQGFQTQELESPSVQLPLQGGIPQWLSGTLIRNTPSKYDFAGQKSVNHWFDGLAMLHNFVFGEGQATYSSKFLQSKAFIDAQREGRLCSREFGSDPTMSLWDRARGVFQPQFTDNANVNVAKIAGSYLTLTETPNVTEFEMDTLKTVGEFKFDDHLSGQLTTAHPHFDYLNNCSFNLLINISAASTYQIYGLQQGSRKRALIATLPVKEPAYIHTFAITERFIILSEFPFQLRPLELLFSGKPYIENYHWSKQGTRFRIVDKNDGKIVAIIEGEPCFSFHHVNAFERGREVIVDALIYPDAAIVGSLSLNNLRANFQGLPSAKLHRFTLNLDSKTMASEQISQLDMELPRINYQAGNGRDYLFAYAAGASSTQDFLDQLIKIDVTSGDAKIWREDGCYPGEPVFVTKPGASREDDGLIISLVLDTRAKTSFLLLLDAMTMEELARLALPHVVPFGFHGQFFGST